MRFPQTPQGDQPLTLGDREVAFRAEMAKLHAILAQCPSTASFSLLFWPQSFKAIEVVSLSALFGIDSKIRVMASTTTEHRRRLRLQPTTLEALIGLERGSQHQRGSVVFWMEDFRSDEEIRESLARINPYRKVVWYRILGDRQRWNWTSYAGPESACREMQEAQAMAYLRAPMATVSEESVVSIKREESPEPDVTLFRSLTAAQRISIQSLLN